MLLDGVLQQNEIVVGHSNTGDYKIHIEQDGKDLRRVELKTRQININNIGEIVIEDEGRFRTRVMGRSDATTVSIVADSPLPTTITAIEHIVTYIRRG